MKTVIAFIPLFAAMSLSFSVQAAEVTQTDLQGCWRQAAAAHDLCFSADSNVVHKATEGAEQGLEYTVADSSVIFIHKERSVPWGICKVQADAPDSQIDLSCDQTGAKFNGTWARRCPTVNANGDDCP